MVGLAPQLVQVQRRVGKGAVDDAAVARPALAAEAELVRAPDRGIGDNRAWFSLPVSIRPTPEKKRTGDKTRGKKGRGGGLEENNNNIDLLASASRCSSQYGWAPV